MFHNTNNRCLACQGAWTVIANKKRVAISSHPRSIRFFVLLTETAFGWSRDCTSLLPLFQSWPLKRKYTPEQIWNRLQTVALLQFVSWAKKNDSSISLSPELYEVVKVVAFRHWSHLHLSSASFPGYSHTLWRFVSSVYFLKPTQFYIILLYYYFFFP